MPIVEHINDFQERWPILPKRTAYVPPEAYLTDWVWLTPSMAPNGLTAPGFDCNNFVSIAYDAGTHLWTVEMDDPVVASQFGALRHNLWFIDPTTPFGTDYPSTTEKRARTYIEIDLTDHAYTGPAGSTLSALSGGAFENAALPTVNWWGGGAATAYNGSARGPISIGWNTESGPTPGDQGTGHRIFSAASIAGYAVAMGYAERADLAAGYPILSGNSISAAAVSTVDSHQIVLGAGSSDDDAGGSAARTVSFKARARLLVLGPLPE